MGHKKIKEELPKRADRRDYATLAARESQQPKLRTSKRQRRIQASDPERYAIQRKFAFLKAYVKDASRLKMQYRSFAAHAEKQKNIRAAAEKLKEGNSVPVVLQKKLTPGILARIRKLLDFSVPIGEIVKIID